MSTLTSNIKKALAKQGFEAVEEVTITKNGVSCTGYRIDTGKHIMPVIYYSEGETVDAFVSKAMKIVEMPLPQIETEDLITREKLLNNTILCIQKRSSEPLAKRAYLNLELYVRLEIDFPGREEKGTVKITPQILKNVGMTEDELFEAAFTNSQKKARITSMAEALGMPEDLFEEVPFKVCSYDDHCYGGAVLALPQILSDYCNENGIKRALLVASSVQECLILPEGSMPPSDLAAICNEVNLSCVDEVLRLDPCVYVFDVETNTVSIAASYHDEEV